MQTLPTYRLLARLIKEMEAVARRVRLMLQAKVGATMIVTTAACASQVGSGASPAETLPSVALAIAPAGRRGSHRLLGALNATLRQLPVPVIGHIENGALLLDLRCLEDTDAFIANFAALTLEDPPDALV